MGPYLLHSTRYQVRRQAITARTDLLQLTILISFLGISLVLLMMPTFLLWDATNVTTVHPEDGMEVFLKCILYCHTGRSFMLTD